MSLNYPFTFLAGVLNEACKHRNDLITLTKKVYNLNGSHSAIFSVPSSIMVSCHRKDFAPRGVNIFPQALTLQILKEINSSLRRIFFPSRADPGLEGLCWSIKRTVHKSCYPL